MSFISTKINFQSIACFICIYLIIFGPKIAGIIDISCLTSLLLLFWGGANAKIQHYAINLVYCLFFAIIYSIVISIFSDNGPMLLFLLRFFRCLLALLCVSCIMESGIINNDTVRKSLIKVLLVHAILVIIGAAFFPSIQSILRPLSGFDRMPSFFRSTGLTNGYDFAGLLCVFGILMVSLGKDITGRVIKTIVFIVAALLTSRMNMILVEIIITYIVFFSKEKDRFYKIILSTLFFITIIPVLGIFLITTQNFNNIIVHTLMKNTFFSSVSNNLVYYYATSDIGENLRGHYNFSRLNNMQLWFGSMQDSKLDPGYTQYIYAIGIFGTIVVLFFYAYVMQRTLAIRHANKNDSAIILIICLLCLIMSVKNSYLLARHVTETMLIMFTLLNKEYENFSVRQIVKREK